MTRTSDTIGSHVDALSAGAGRLLAIRPMRAPLATPGMFDWTSGTNHWLLDVISPNSRGTAAVIASFRQLVPDGRMKIHPGILRLLDAETLKNWGVQKTSAPTSENANALGANCTGDQGVSA